VPEAIDEIEQMLIKNRHRVSANRSIWRQHLIGANPSIPIRGIRLGVRAVHHSKSPCSDGGSSRVTTDSHGALPA